MMIIKLNYLLIGKETNGMFTPSRYTPPRNPVEATRLKPSQLEVPVGDTINLSLKVQTVLTASTCLPFQ